MGVEGFEWLGEWVGRKYRLNIQLFSEGRKEKAEGSRLAHRQVLDLDVYKQKQIPGRERLRSLFLFCSPGCSGTGCVDQTDLEFEPGLENFHVPHPHCPVWDVTPMSSHPLQLGHPRDQRDSAVPTVFSVWELRSHHPQIQESSPTSWDSVSQS